MSFDDIGKKGGNQDMRYEAIIDYEMDNLEAAAYKICLIWIDRSRKIFPDYQHQGMKRGDPRKSLLFKICYKLVRETQGGILDENDYSLYVRAQLEVLKHIEKNGGRPLVDANCLVGDKAWKRWRLWKSKYDALASKPSEIPQDVGPGEKKAIEGFKRTKEFIVKTLGAEPPIEKYKEIYLNNNLFRWVNFGKISPYYIAISPYIAKLMKPEDFKRMSFDPSLYKSCITDSVIQKFQEIFHYEFK
jgi:hypothetical protein